MTDFIKSEASIQLCIHETFFRIVFFDNQYYTWQPETPVKTISGIMEFNISEHDAEFITKHFMKFGCLPLEDELIIEGEFDYGKATSFRTRLLKAVTQTLENHNG